MKRLVSLTVACDSQLTPSGSTGWPDQAVMNAFSARLLMSAVAGIVVGRLLDRLGPRLVMTLGSLLGIAALLSVATAPSPQWSLAAWMFAGQAQSMLLHTPAFAALTRWYGSAAGTRADDPVPGRRAGQPSRLAGGRRGTRRDAGGGDAAIARDGVIRAGDSGDDHRLVQVGGHRVLRVEVRAGADQRNGVRAAAGGRGAARRRVPTARRAAAGPGAAWRAAANRWTADIRSCATRLPRLQRHTSSAA
jgi:hypothetical protein